MAPSSAPRRVALVLPPFLMARYTERGEYLGIGYLGAIARAAGHDVQIIDAEFQGLDRAGAVAEVLRLAPDVVGLGGSFAPDLVAIVRFARGLRERGYQGLIVAGGNPASASHRALLELGPEIDVVVRGEADETFLELLERATDRASWGGIAGIAYRDRDKVHATPVRCPPDDLDALPRPLRENSSTHGEPACLGYARRTGLRPFAFVASSRGCPFRCSFCGVAAFQRATGGRPWRPRSADDVVEELAELAERWDIRTFRFVDDNFFGSSKVGRERAAEIARLILRRGLQVDYTIECCAQDVEPHLFALLRRSGLRRVHVGIESGSDHALRVYGKTASVAQNRQAISVLNDLGIRFNPNFILVHPETTLEELRETADFLRATRLYRSSDDIATLFTNRLGVLFGTPMYERLAAEGRLRQWQYPGISPEDQELAHRIGNMFDYTFSDERVTHFLRVQRPAVMDLLERHRAIDAFRRAPAAGEEPSPHLAPTRHWIASLGAVALQQMTEAITVAETRPCTESVVHDARQRLQDQLDQHDRTHFGVLARDLEPRPSEKASS